MRERGDIPLYDSEPERQHDPPSRYRDRGAIPLYDSEPERQHAPPSRRTTVPQQEASAKTETAARQAEASPWPQNQAGSGAREAPPRKAYTRERTPQVQRSRAAEGAQKAEAKANRNRGHQGRTPPEGEGKEGAGHHTTSIIVNRVGGGNEIYASTEMNPKVTNQQQQCQELRSSAS